MSDSKKTSTGLNDSEVVESAKKFGTNSVEHQKKNHFLNSILDIVKEPMFLLLFTATSIYFITGDYGDGIFMAFAIVFVMAISVFQESRSRNAIEALKKLTQPKCKVIRNGSTIEIPTEEIVIGDCVQLEEGAFIPADGIILSSNDFSVNESILTGESLAVFKSNESENKQVFQGTIVASGLAICEVTAIGNKTQLGKIGSSLNAIEEEKTPLQIQIGNFVTKMSIIGLVIFAIVWAINYYNSGLVLDSLLKALTLAMSVIPEEIPVAFTTFMALGAWRLMKMGIITKQTKTVETLGSATVICTDKTGTITENRMSLAELYLFKSNSIVATSQKLNPEAEEVLNYAMWSSEPIPFDAMEIAIHEAYSNFESEDERPYFKLVHEYPLGGKPPMMTHVFENESGKKIIAAKGAPEALQKLYKKVGSVALPYKAVVNGFSDTVLATLKLTDTIVKPENIVFKTQNGALINATRSNNTFELTVKGNLSYAEEQILATVKQGDKWKVVGAFMLVHISTKEVNVDLVPTDTDSEKKLEGIIAKAQEIYSKGGVKINFKKKGVLDISGVICELALTSSMFKI